jgi:hypothetical protein
MLRFLWPKWSWQGALRSRPEITIVALTSMALGACFLIAGRLSYSNLRFLKTPRELGVQLGSVAIALAIFALLAVGIDHIRSEY